MKRLLLMLAVLLLVFSSGAHADHQNDTDAGTPEAGTAGLMTVTAVIFGVMTLSGLAFGFFNPQTVTSRYTLLMIGLVALTSVSLTLSLENQAENTGEALGPGLSPMHMEGFYEDVDMENVPEANSISRDPSDMPSQIQRNSSKTVNITLVAEEVRAPLTGSSDYYYWTFNRSVPGPTLRVREGDTVRLTLKNRAQNTHNHSIDLHSVTGPGGGAGVLGDVPPGEQRTIEFEASKQGFYAYHCATENVPTHIANGMYGGIIVEPESGMNEVDREYTVTQGELYTREPAGADGLQKFDPAKLMNEEPTYYTMNGVPRGLTGENMLEAEVNDSIRIFYVNAGNSRVASFHMIGEVIDRVYRGSLEEPSETDIGISTVGAAQGSVFEFHLDNPGNYTLVDHSLARMEKGAWGLLEVSGSENGVPLERVER
jgi:nitrite reductase (NO-forming)